MDRVVCRPSSVLCSVDIVKRVVTVKQVRPSPLRRGEVGPGAWVCVLPVREHRQGAAVCAAVQGAMIGKSLPYAAVTSAYLRVRLGAA